MGTKSATRPRGGPGGLVYPSWVEDLPPGQQDVVRELMPLMDRLATASGDDFHAVELISKSVESYYSGRAKTDKRRDLALAILRGKVAREELKHEEGGSLSSSEAAGALGISKTALLKRYKQGQVLGWREAKQDIVRLPVWQFEGDHLLSGLAEVLKILNSAPWMDDWGRILFFLNRSSADGARPLDLLRNGKSGEALALAKAAVE